MWYVSEQDDGTLNGIARIRGRDSWRRCHALRHGGVDAIGAGAFQKLYVTIHFQDTAALREFWTEAPFRRIPGLRQLLWKSKRGRSPAIAFFSGRRIVRGRAGTATRSGARNMCSPAAT
jgi:hypothetical protein